MAETKPTVKSTVTGRQLAHGNSSTVVRAFVADDLFRGRLNIVRPTMAQAAALARVSAAYAWAAHRHAEDREAIVNGLAPLMPARSRIQKNGIKPLVKPIKPLITSMSDDLDDTALINLVRCIGTSRVLEAACAVEASQ
jgi:hypothetical protein